MSFPKSVVSQGLRSQSSNISSAPTYTSVGKTAVSVSEIPKKEQQICVGDILPNVAPSPGAGPYVAMVLCLIISTFLLVVPFVVIPITGFSVVLSNTGRNAYAIGTTILAGIISSFIVGQIKELQIADVLHITPTRGYNPARTGQTSWTILAPIRRAYSDPSRVAKTALGFGTIRDKAALWPQTISLLIVGLLTTGIVGGLGPNVYTATTQVPEWTFQLDDDGSCFHTSSNSKTPPSQPNPLNWTLANGSWLAFDAGMSLGSTKCAVVPMIQLFSSTIDNTNGIAYEIADKPFRPGSIGMPVLFNATANYLANFAVIKNSSSNYGPYGEGQFVRSEACMPVLTENPVKCTSKADSFMPSSNGSVIAIGDGCNATITQGNTKAAAICTGGVSVGQATYVLGDRFGMLSRMLQNRSESQGTQSFPTAPEIGKSHINTTVTCKVDIGKAIDFRTVRMDYLGQLNGDTPWRVVDLIDDTELASAPQIRTRELSYVLSGTTSRCTPRNASGGALDIANFKTDRMLAQAASSSWALISDWATPAHNLADPAALNAFTDRHVTRSDRIVPLFNDSMNHLEDIFGIISGMAVSSYYRANSVGGCYSSDWQKCVQANPELYKADARLWGNESSSLVQFPAASVSATSMMIGPGQWWACVFAGPALYALVMLAWLLQRRIQYARALVSKAHQNIL